MYFKKAKKWWTKTVKKVVSQVSTHKDRGGDKDFLPAYMDALVKYNDATRKYHGWPTDHDCDATLFAGLAKGSGASVNLDLAKDPKTKAWNRRPLSPHGPCNVNGVDCGSKSTISNDQILGIAYGSVSEPSRAKEIAEYARRHKMIMGSPRSRLGEVFLKPYMYSLLQRVANEPTKYPVIFTGNSKDYVTHLTAIAIHTYGRVHGKIEGHHLEMLRKLRRDDRQNPTFEALVQRYTDGNYARAVGLLTSGYVPSYIRGNKNYPLVYRLFTWAIITGQERPR